MKPAKIKIDRTQFFGLNVESAQTKDLYGTFKNVRKSLKGLKGLYLKLFEKLEKACPKNNIFWIITWSSCCLTKCHYGNYSLAKWNYLESHYGQCAHAESHGSIWWYKCSKRCFENLHSHSNICLDHYCICI